MKPILRLPLLCLCICLGSSAISAQFAFLKTYDIANSDLGNYIQQDINGNFQILGKSDAFGADPMDYVLWTDVQGQMIDSKTLGPSSIQVLPLGTDRFVKLNNQPTRLSLVDINGQEYWSQTYATPAPYGLQASSFNQTQDGGYIIAGGRFPPAPSSEALIIRTNSIGEQTWQTPIPIFRSFAQGIIEASDKQLYAFGQVTPAVSVTFPFIQQLDAAGNLHWRYTIPGYNLAIMKSICETQNGDIAFTGFAKQQLPPNKDVLFLGKLDKMGNQLWLLEYPLDQGINPETILCTPDNGLLIGGTAGDEVTLLLTDANGEIQWRQHYGLPNSGSAYHLIQTIDGGFAATGSINKSGQPSDIFLLKTGPQGQLNIDLELDIVSSYLPFKQYQEARFTAILVNKGTTIATGVSVHFPKPEGGVFSGGFEYNSTQGTYQPYGNQIWEVGRLAVGDTAEIEINFFTLQADPPITVYAQVIAANEPDVDGTPNNGTPPLPNEDDEAVLFFGDEPILLALENNAPPSSATMSEVRIVGLDQLGEVELISNLPAPVNNNTTNFNGAAYDIVSGRFYFTRFDGAYQTSELFYNDLEGHQQSVAQLGAAVTSGTFYQGNYYYIAQLSDDLFRVNLNPDGSFISETHLSNFLEGTIYEGQWLGFGDIAFSLDGAYIYGSATRQGAAPTTVFFRMNADGSDYTEICNTTDCGFQAGSTQIAFGTDARLYGVNSLGNQEFYRINSKDGSGEIINLLDRSISDLSIGTATIISPDLTITNIDLPVQGTAGSVLNFQFELSNIGNTSATDDYLITHYLSSDNQLSTDDVWVGEVLTGNTPAGVTFNVPASINLPTNISPGNYYLILIVDTNNDIAEFSETNNQLSSPLTITNDPTGDGIDLSLSIDGATEFDIYQFYTPTIKITNSGNVTATGVRVHVPLPAGTVYAGGDEYTTSQGVYNPYSNQEWDLGTLAPGEMAFLNPKLFPLKNQPVTIYSQVVAANEPDIDSSPNNGTPPSVNEDDEAVLIPTSASIRTEKATSDQANHFSRQLHIHKIFPTPATTTVNIVLQVNEPGEYQVAIYNVHGTQMKLIEWELAKGVNQRSLDISALADGLLVIQIKSKGSGCAVRVVKQQW